MRRARGAALRRQRLESTNEVLDYEWLKTEAGNRLGWADCGADDDAPALVVLRGDPVPEKSESGRHFLSTRSGLRPLILPSAMIYLPNPLLRLAYRIVFGWKNRKAVERRREMDAARQAAIGRARAAE